MLRLTFHDTGATPAAALHLTDFRLTGGALWNPLEHGLIATYFDGTWRHRGRYYRALAVTGGARLLFGITRDPTFVSAPIDHLSFIGPSLSTNGVAIAKYVEEKDVWHAVVRSMWWMSMRVISALSMPTLISDGSTIVPMNPWEPQPDQGGIADPVLDDPHESSASPSG
jgi:hypothetical protein